MAKTSSAMGATGDLIHERTTAGTERSQVYVIGEDGTDNVVGPLSLVGTTRALPTVGAPYTATTGTITSATGTVTSGDIALAGNITIAVYGTYAGLNVTFEVSPDAGTNWFPATAVREDSGITEATSGALTNTARMWTMAAPGFNRVRVRATAWTSGTASIIINPGTYPFEPTVAAVLQQPSTKVTFALTINATPTTSEALMSGTPLRGVTAGGAATSQTVTAGKTLRLTSLSIGLVSTAAAVMMGFVAVRVRASGTLAVTDPVLWRGRLSTNSAVSSSAGFFSASFPDGLDLPSGTVFGISAAAGATTGTWDITLAGYEF